MSSPIIVHTISANVYVIASEIRLILSLLISPEGLGMRFFIRMLVLTAFCNLLCCIVYISEGTGFSFCHGNTKTLIFKTHKQFFGHRHNTFSNHVLSAFLLNTCYIWGENSSNAFIFFGAKIFYTNIQIELQRLFTSNTSHYYLVIPFQKRTFPKENAVSMLYEISIKFFNL